MDIKAIIAQMTLEEKASLLSGLDFWHTKPVDRLGVKSCMVSDGPHGLRKQAEGEDHLGVNQSISAVCFPTGCATAASFDRDLLKKIGEAIGDSCRHEEVSVVLGPAVNIKRSPLCGRNFEYYSEDPYLAGEIAASYIEGVQSRDVGVSLKHFAANSQEHRRMSSDSVVDERTLREIYLAPFEIAVKKARPWTVMCSYNRINGVFSSDNRWLLTDLLRGEWGFDGYVVSDWGATADRVLGVVAGMDLEMPASGGCNDALVVRAVREGKLDEKLVDLCCERILTINQRYLDNAKPDTPWDMDAQHDLARRLAAECVVLLKNDDAILPLDRSARVAVIGRFAKEPRYQGGGSSHINSFKTTSAMEALSDRLNIAYADGYEIDKNEPDEKLIAEAEALARDAEVAVLFVGLPDSFESEGYDRAHMRMPTCQEALIARVAAVNPNTVVVLHNGSPIEMPWIHDVKAVLECYLGGQAVGGAAVDVLFGDKNPCGRLPESFPLRLEDNPSYPWYGGEGDVAEYREGVFVGYRWYDKKNMDVLYPFGYGLSYTTFAYGNLRLSAADIRDDDMLTVCVDVTNTGGRAGKEVVQLYVSECAPRVIRPTRELKGFEKVSLEPNETKTVRFTLDKRAFAYWHTGLHDWHVDTGVFAVEIGRSSRDIALSHEVNVQSTTSYHEKTTVNTTVGDLLESPRAAAILKPLLEAGASLMSGAGDAVSSQMLEAMLKYLPLRALTMFSGGMVTLDQVNALVDAINHSEL